ncbi:hypothetical protein FFLO_07145 [Filobasidium floriforme]|uniref:Uncharacterized protein n=1 Tax=Filobasidium floriforme TaxID=5210 RepID=A0A8K0NLF7_9TREE|nr:hypothetical protein FFLO_07145 [Filobasidium floriforme]
MSKAPKKNTPSPAKKANTSPRNLPRGPGSHRCKSTRVPPPPRYEPGTAQNPIVVRDDSPIVVRDDTPPYLYVLTHKRPFVVVFPGRPPILRHTNSVVVSTARVLAPSSSYHFATRIVVFSVLFVFSWFYRIAQRSYAS